MKRVIVLTVVIGLFGFDAVAPALAQVRGRGLSALLCLVEEVGVPANAQISVTIVSDFVDAEGNGTAIVTITHGAPQSGSGSTHGVLYQDDGSGDLGCGDTIISVS